MQPRMKVCLTLALLIIVCRPLLAFQNLERNRQVAQAAGAKHGVHPALLLAIRYHEQPQSPSKDGLAYGVMHRKGTTLEIQAHEAARIVARVAKAQGWRATEPTKSRVQRLGKVYCGKGARQWARSVWNIYRRVK